MTFLLALVPPLVLLLGFIPIGLFILYRIHRARSETLHSPLSQDMLRPPGHSLTQQLQELNFEIDALITWLALIPLVAYSVHISQSHFGELPDSTIRIAATLTAVVILWAFFGWRLSVQIQKWRTFQLGLEGEQFTGQELDQLMLDGCRVFHDIEFQYGNIDHVVVSPGGVFSINTKTLRKKIDPGDAKAIVIPDTNEIRFPHRTYQVPVKRLRAEAKWLQSHLASSTGESVGVEPLLALPGWFIERPKGKAAIRIFNPRNPQSFFRTENEVLSERRIQQIAHQLEQLCRNVPRSQRVDKSWNAKK